jgi:biopolymer transport protein TolR
MAGPTGYTTEPNVTPMIDVLLVLLIAFMIMVTQMRHSMDVQLPQPCRDFCASGDQIVLEVLPGAAYRVNQKPVDHAALQGYLASLYQRRPDKVIAVAGRPGVLYNEVIEAMDVARSAGVRVISAVPKGL